MTLDWSRMYRPEWEQERDELIRQAQARAQDGPRSDPPPSPALTDKTQGLAPTAVRSDGAARPPSAVAHLEPLRPEQPAVVRPTDPIDVLSAALDAAPSDARRAELLAAAPRDVREQLRVRLVYLQFMRAQDDPYAAFERALDAASDDATRRALISGRDAAFLAEWAWRVRASAEDWQRRYLELAT